MASAAIDYGADALLVYPPSWLKHHEQRDSLIVKHHERLSALGLPLVLFYLYEAAGGVCYTTEAYWTSCWRCRMWQASRWRRLIA